MRGPDSKKEDTGQKQDKSFRSALPYFTQIEDQEGKLVSIESPPHIGVNIPADVSSRHIQGPWIAIKHDSRACKRQNI